MKGVFLRKQKQQQFIRSLHFDLNVKGRPRSNNMKKQKRSLPPPPLPPLPPVTPLLYQKCRTTHNHSTNLIVLLT